MLTEDLYFKVAGLTSSFDNEQLNFVEIEKLLLIIQDIIIKNQILGY